MFLLTTRRVAHLVVHGTSGSTSYEMSSGLSGGVLSTVDMVVQRRDGPRRLRDDDDDDDVFLLLVLITALFFVCSSIFLALLLCRLGDHSGRSGYYRHAGLVAAVHCYVWRLTGRWLRATAPR